jgi:hypothetical protein
MSVVATTAPRQLPRHWLGMAVGFSSGLMSTALTVVLTDSVAFIYLGALLAGIGWVYFGFGVADGRPSAIAVQVSSASVFLILGLLGAYHHSAALLGVGFLLHGAWDYVHHDDHGPTHVRTWYPPFCVVADITIGLPLIAGLVL